jgi:hypothetical protein
MGKPQKRTQEQEKDTQTAVFGTCPLTENRATIEENSANLFCSECILTLGHKGRDSQPYEKSKKHFKDHIVEPNLE